MPCYAKNPVLLFTSGCSRTVCTHCRIDVRVSPLPEAGTEPCEEVLRNLPPPAPELTDPSHFAVQNS